MHVYLRVLLFGALWAACGLAPRRAVAECRTGYTRNAVGVSVTQPALDALSQPLISMLPPSFELPNTSTELFDCFIDIARLETSQTTLELVLDSARLQLESGAVRVTLTGDIVANTHFDAYVCEIMDQSCDGTLTAQRVVATGLVRPNVSACAASFPTEAVVLEVAPEDVVAELDGCGLYGDVFDLVQSVAKEQILDLARAELESLLGELVSEYLSAFTNEAVEQDLDVEGIRLALQPQDIEVTPTRLSFALRGDARPSKLGATCLPPDTAMPPPVGDAPAFTFPNAMAAVGISEAFSQRVLSAAWLTGWLCFDTRTLDFDLSSWLQPIMPGALLSAVFVPETPPVLDFSPADGSGARLDVTRARADVALELPNGQVHRATASAGLAMDLEVGVDDDTRTISITPAQAALVGTTIQLGENTLGLSEDGVRGLLDTVVIPALRSSLGGLPLVSGLFAAAPLALVVDDTALGPNAAIATLSLLPIDPDDTMPPNTVVQAQPTCPCGPSLSIGMGSVDNSTPLGLIRHEVRIGDVVLSPVSAGAEVRLDGLAGGRRRVEVRAIDLAGNGDPTPVHLELDIDDVEPVVELPDAPLGIVTAAGASLTVQARDDRSAPSELALSYEVGVVSRDNEPDRVLARGELRGPTLSIYGLPDGATVRVTVTARDHAGNEGSAQAQFAVVHEPTMGCSAGLAQSATSVVALGLLAALRRLRRREQKALR